MLRYWGILTACDGLDRLTDQGSLPEPRTTKGLASDDANPLSCMVFPTGVEPVACPLGGDRSIQLSYGNLVAGIIQEAAAF